VFASGGVALTPVVLEAAALTPVFAAGAWRACYNGLLLKSFGL